MNRRSLLAVLTTLTLTAACDQATAPTSQVAPNSPTTEGLTAVGPNGPYSGRAITVNAKILGKLPVKICDTGPLPRNGGALGQNGPSATIPGILFLQTFNCRTNGVNFVASADAFVASLLLTLHGNTIKAVVLSSNATAKCQNGTPTAFGNSSILELTVNGTKHVVGTAPNVTIPLIGGYIVVNEQTKSVNQFSAIIDVTALHIVIKGVLTPLADIAISHTHADIDCP